MISEIILSQLLSNIIGFRMNTKKETAKSVYLALVAENFIISVYCRMGRQTKSDDL